MRGSHPGSFKAAHALRRIARAAPTDTGEQYDLIVVGAGISGLAAAHFDCAQRTRAASSFPIITMISAATPSATNSISAIIASR
jgi:hypothetical protein